MARKKRTPVYQVAATGQRYGLVKKDDPAGKFTDRKTGKKYNLVKKPASSAGVPSPQPTTSSGGSGFKSSLHPRLANGKFRKV